MTQIQYIVVGCCRSSGFQVAWISVTPKCSSQKCLLQPHGYRRMGSPSCSLFFIVATVASVKQPMWHPSPYQVGSHGDHPSPGVDNYQYFTQYPSPWSHAFLHLSCGSTPGNMNCHLAQKQSSQRILYPVSKGQEGQRPWALTASAQLQRQTLHYHWSIQEQDVCWCVVLPGLSSKIFRPSLNLPTSPAFWRHTQTTTKRLYRLRTMDPATMVSVQWRHGRVTQKPTAVGDKDHDCTPEPITVIGIHGSRGLGNQHAVSYFVQYANASNMTARQATKPLRPNGTWATQETNATA